jgi:hypothetical protein
VQKKDARPQETLFAHLSQIYIPIRKIPIAYQTNLRMHHHCVHPQGKELLQFVKKSAMTQKSKQLRGIKLSATVDLSKSLKHITRHGL